MTCGRDARGPLADDLHRPIPQPEASSFEQAADGKAGRRIGSGGAEVRGLVQQAQV